MSADLCFKKRYEMSSTESKPSTNVAGRKNLGMFETTARSLFLHMKRMLKTSKPNSHVYQRRAKHQCWVM